MISCVDDTASDKGIWCMISQFHWSIELLPCLHIHTSASCAAALSVFSAIKVLSLDFF